MQATTRNRWDTFWKIESNSSNNTPIKQLQNKSSRYPRDFHPSIEWASDGFITATSQTVEERSKDNNITTNNLTLGLTVPQYST